MKIEKMKCPGCGKHCPLSSPRCKFGRHYAEKMTEKLSPPLENKAKKEKMGSMGDSGGFDLAIPEYFMPDQENFAG